MEILYIEDDEVDRLYFSRLCEKLGSVNCQIVPDFEAASQILLHHPFDLIVSDYKIGLNEFKDYQHLFTDHPLVLLTGQAPENIPSFPNLIAVYAKPISMDQVAQLVEERTPYSPPTEPENEIDADWPQHVFPEESRAFRAELLRTFLEVLEKETQHIFQAHQDGEYDQLSRACHQLKSSFRLLGHREATERLELMESQSKNLLHTEHLTAQMPSLLRILKEAETAARRALKLLEATDSAS